MKEPSVRDLAGLMEQLKHSTKRADQALDEELQQSAEFVADREQRDNAVRDLARAEFRHMDPVALAKALGLINPDPTRLE